MTTLASQRYPELSAEGLAALGAGTACDAEPIHRCGAIQPHGFLIAVDPDDLTVVAASENVAEHLWADADPGVDRPQVLGADLVDVLGPQIVESVLWGVMSSNPHEGLPVRLQLPPGEEYDMVAHLSGELLVLELEPTSGGESAASAAFYQRQRSAMQKLGTVDRVDRICQLAAEEVRALTGYDAVRVYRFEPDAHGVVIAEACAPGVESYLGLHYPAGDIPRQARALYLRNWIRVIGDVGYEPVPIRTVAALRPEDLDLTMSVLRSVSPVHLEYLRNMGVIASMSISIVVENQLWGLVACHHNSPRPVRHVERLACETIGQLVSVRIRGAQTVAVYEEAAALGRTATQVVTAMVAGETPAMGAINAGESLLGMVSADGAVVDLDGLRASTGQVPSPPAIEQLVARLSAQAGEGRRYLATDDLAQVLADDPVEAPDAMPAGALFLPFSGRARGFVLWLRGEHAQTVRWAGRVGDKPGAPDDAAELPSLTPRASFAEWAEQRRGRSAPWRAAEVTAATQLVDAIPDVLLHRSQSRLVRFALHDPLTGLPNRRLLLDRLDQLLATLDLRPPAVPGPGEAVAGRLPVRAGHPAAGLLFVELDGVSTRTAQGHSVGEELLTLIAERLRALVEPTDTVARMGGYEFVVLLPGADAAEACVIGERIIDELRRSFVLDGQASRSLSVSVGVSSIAPGTEVTEALRQVDAALYHARRIGRNQVAVYDPTTGTTASQEQHAVAQLKKALAAGQLQLHYQPIVDLSRVAAPGDDPTVGFEALLRWRLPHRGLLTPDRFVAMAEKTGLIHDLGRAVIAQAAQQLRALPDEQSVSINVSVHELARADFVSSTLARLEAAAVDPRRVCVEVKETQLMEDPHLAVAGLRELQAAGFGIAVDDYGIGFSSLAALRGLPQLTLKISNRLVAGLPDDPADRAVVQSVVQLAHALGWRTVTEGVHTAEQLAVVRELGTDLAQGDGLGRPVPGQPVELPAS